MTMADHPIHAVGHSLARRGPHQRVVLTVHVRVSLADEWADKKQIIRRGSGCWITLPYHW